MLQSTYLTLRLRVSIMKLNLTNGGKDYISRMRQRINSLLIQPTDLRFVWIINTPKMEPEETRLMGRLLPSTPARFSDGVQLFGIIHQKNYPTPLQMQFIWNSQRNLHNQNLCSQMVPALDIVLKERGPSQSALLKYFTKLEINDQTHKCLVNIQSLIWVSCRSCESVDSLWTRLLCRHWIPSLPVDPCQSKRTYF